MHTLHEESASGQPRFSCKLSSRTRRLEIVLRANSVLGLGTEISKETEKDRF